MTINYEAESFEAALYVANSRPEAWLCFQNFRAVSDTTDGISVDPAPHASIETFDTDYLYVNSGPNINSNKFRFNFIGSSGNKLNYNIICLEGPQTGRYLKRINGHIGTTSDINDASGFGLTQNLKEIKLNDIASEAEVELVCFDGGVELHNKNMRAYSQHQYTAEVITKKGNIGLKNFQIRISKRGLT